MTKHRVFVYGTLRKGLAFASALSGSEFLGEASTKDKFGFFFYRYPAATSLSFDFYVKGELYLVSAETLAELDLIEGHPDFYRRRPVYVLKEDGTEDNVWMYFLNLDVDVAEKKGVPIADGDFAEFSNRYL